MIIEEIRIYYESTEQGCDYVLPIIQKILKSLDRDVLVRCIKLIGNYEVYSKRIAPIIYWKDADCLISIIVDKKEYPLFAIEFSQAVFTKDHDLQRFDAITSALTNNTISIKISSISKISPGERYGGEVNFNHLEPYALVKQHFGKYSFHFDWPCTLPDTLKIDPKLPSCPPSLPNFEKILKITMNGIFDMNNLDNLLDDIPKLLNKDSFFQKWFKDIDSTLVSDLKSLRSNRTKWIPNDSYFKKDIFELKINRMGHAMDPERGMIPYYGILSDSLVTKMCFTTQKNTWYTAIGATDKIKEYLDKNGLLTPYDFLTCFAMGTSLSNNPDFKKILESAKTNKSDPFVIDISNFVSNHFLYLSKPLRTIFAFSDTFVIEDDSEKRRVILKFTKQKVSLDFFNDYPEITPIDDGVKMTEDEVTYCVIHNIFKENNLPIFSASYPGAQGDRALLINPGSGKNQPREYADVLSGKSDKTIVCENKGPYQKQKILKDIEKIKSFKTPKYSQAIQNFHLKFQTGINHLGIVIGVGFWINSASEKSLLNELTLNGIDFIILISSDIKTWKILDLTKSNIFKSLSGEVSLPGVYSIVPIKER